MGFILIWDHSLLSEFCRDGVLSFPFLKHFKHPSNVFTTTPISKPGCFFPCSCTDHPSQGGSSQEGFVPDPIPSHPGPVCAELQPLSLPQRQPQVLWELPGWLQPPAPGSARGQPCSQHLCHLLTQQQLQQGKSPGHIFVSIL